MTIVKTLSELLSMFGERTWMIEVFVIVFATMLLNLFISIFYKKVLPKITKSKSIWDSVVAYAAYNPLKLLIWVLGLTFAAEVGANVVKNAVIFKAITPIREIAVIALVTWFLVRFIHKGAKEYTASATHKRALDNTTIFAISQILKVSIIITSALIGIQTLGFNISGLLALGGVGGIAVSLAAKDMLSNFFGGLMIYFDRPFAVGDWVRSPDRNIEGTVEYIGMRLTRIRTFDKRPLYVPNGVFSTISVENPSRMLNRRILKNIGIRYNDASKMGEIVKGVDKMLHEHQDIDSTQTTIVNFVNFGPSSLDFMVSAYTKTTDWVTFQKVQEDVFLKIIDIVTGFGAEFAFPTQTLHLPEMVPTSASDRLDKTKETAK